MTEKIIAFVERCAERGYDVLKLVRVGQQGGIEEEWDLKVMTSPEDVTHAIEETARNLACDATERVKFVIQPWRGNDRGASFPLPPFEPSMASMVLAGNRGVTARSVEHPLDALVQGLIQSQTHEEHMHRLGVVGLATAMDSLRDENAELRRHVRHLESRARREAQEREEFESKKHERDMDKRREASREDRREKIVAKVLPLFPAIVSKFMGRPDKTSPMGMALQAFGDSLTDQQMDAIYSALTVEQRIAIGMVLDKKQPGAKKDEPKAEDASPEAPSGAADKKGA